MLTKDIWHKVADIFRLYFFSDISAFFHHQLKDTVDTRIIIAHWSDEDKSCLPDVFCTKYTHLIHIFYLPSAAEEDGRQNPQIPSPQQRDFRHPEQVPEVWRRREHAGGTRPMLPATDTPVARQQLRCRSRWDTLDQREVPNTVIITRLSTNIPHLLQVFSSKGPLNVRKLGHILWELFFCIHLCLIRKGIDISPFWTNYSLFYTCRKS